MPVGLSGRPDFYFAGAVLGLATGAGSAAAKPENTMSGDDELCREIAVRPAHTSVAVARVKFMMPSCRHPRAPFSFTATCATSLLNSVTYIDRIIAKGRPGQCFVERDISVPCGYDQRSPSVTVALPPRSKVSVSVRVFGINRDVFDLDQRPPVFFDRTNQKR